MGGKRRVFPLQVQTPNDAAAPSAAQRSLLPPKSPLHGARAAGVSSGNGGFERMLLLRNMNVSVAVSGAEDSGAVGRRETTSVQVALPPGVEEVSAAQNLKERKQLEARRRVEVQLMALEDYTDTPEGEARLRRQDERARMQEEELRMQRIVQQEKAQRRAQQLRRQVEEEARVKEMYLAKRRHEIEEQARVAAEKEAARKQALQAKMKALKEEADRKAREEYAARQKKLEDEAQAERDVRVAESETNAMHVEDLLSVAMRNDWLAEQERRKQIEAEALEWKLFEESEAARQREETRKRREAQKEQYEQDRARRMQIHRLQQERVRTAAGKKRQQEQESEGVSAASAAATSLQRLRSQCDSVEMPPLVIPQASPSEVSARDQSTVRRSAETARPQQSGLGVINEQALVPPPPALAPAEFVNEPEPREIVATEENEARFDADKVAEGVDIPSEPTSLLTNEPTPPILLAPAEGAVVLQQELLSLEQLRLDGVTPMAEVLSVTAGSPAAVAGLAVHDLVIDFGGVTSATPKCIVAIAERVQQNVDNVLSLVVLRPTEEREGDAQVQRCELQLVPRKWKGKGLLGCQLSPFKWPAVTSVVDREASTAASSAAESPASAASAYDALVLYQVQPGSLAHRLGLVDGDVLARCGDLDLAGGSAEDSLTAVASYLHTHWRAARRESLVTIQRWDPHEQCYAVFKLVLPAPAAGEPLGCALTTYAQFYYPNGLPEAAPPACDECFYTSLASSLHAAALSGHVSCLESLISTCSPEFLDWRDDEGRSPLFYACYAQQAHAVQCLVRHLQSVVGSYDPVSGADAYGDSPLHAAASSDCVPAIECLLDSRFIADVNLVNASTQATAAHVAASETALKLLHGRFHADVLALDGDGRMPLFYACLRNDAASVAFLCALFPDFADYADSAGGNTPLHMAAWCGFGEVVATLMRALPSIALFVPNQDGLDARALAERAGWSDVANELAQAMARSA